MVIPWRDLAAGADAVLDEHFGEVARLVPMRPADYDGSMLDPERAAIEVIGVLQTQGDQSIGLVGDRAGSPMMERIAVGDIVFSVAASSLGSFDPRPGDRVVMLDAERGGKTYEINRVPRSATGRVRLVLIEAPE